MRKKIEKQRRDYVNNRDSLLSRKIKRLQGWLWSQILDIMTDFDVDEEGFIKSTTKNVNQVTRLNGVFDTFNRQIKRGLLNWLARSIQGLFGLNKEYFREVDKRTPKKSNQVENFILNQLGYKNGKVVRGSWLDSLSNTDAIKTTVFQRMNSAITGGMSMKDFKKTFRNDFIGKNGLGYVERHYNTFVRDFFMATDRQVQKSYAVNLGLSYLIYAGTLKNNTRDFCAARINNLYTDKEVNKWETKDWQGKNKNVSVWIGCGGYNCRHHFSFISEELAETMIKRGKEVNTYNSGVVIG